MDLEPQRDGGDPPGPPLASPTPAPGTLIAAFVVVMASIVALLWLSLSIVTALAVVAAAALIAICLAHGAVRPLAQLATRGASALPDGRGPAGPGLG